MSSTQEVSHSIKESLKDKVTHPLLGSFIISWFFFNWKAVYFMLFANIDSIYKLKNVSENYSDICLNLLFPLASALILGFVLPWTTALFTRSAATANEYYLNSQPLHYKKHRLTIEESNKLRDLYLEKDSATQNELTTYREKLDATKIDCQTRIEKFKEQYKNRYLLLAKCNIEQHSIDNNLVSAERLDLYILQYFFDKSDGGYSCYRLMKESSKYSDTESREAYNKLQSNQSLVDIHDTSDEDEAPIGITDKGIEYICFLKNKVIANSINEF